MGNDKKKRGLWWWCSMYKSGFLFCLLFLLWLGFLFIFFGLKLHISLFQQGLESIFDSFDLFSLLLIEFSLDRSHIFLHSFLLHLLKSSQSLKILFFGHFSGENISHYIILIIFIYPPKNLKKGRNIIDGRNSTRGCQHVKIGQKTSRS